MLASHPIASLVRRLVRGGERTPAERIARRMLRALDARDFERMKVRYAGTPKAKYFEIGRYLPSEIRRARSLGLDQSPPLRVLDVGCGFGYFGWVCQHLGHRVLGIDLPRSAHDPDAVPSTADLYDDACRLFGLERTLCVIRPFEPLPDLPGAPFDVLSANHVTFNGHGTDRVWGPEEWGYFLDDAGRQLLPGARILLGLNAEGDTGRFCTDALRAFFEQRGATVDRQTVDLRTPETRDAATG